MSWGGGSELPKAGSVQVAHKVLTSGPRSICGALEVILVIRGLLGCNISIRGLVWTLIARLRAGIEQGQTVP